MTKPIRLVDAARDELLAEVAKYGAGFTRAARAAFKLIARFPEAWAPYPKRPGVRRYVMKRYPFVIVYRELATEMRVLAVAAPTDGPAIGAVGDRPTVLRGAAEGGPTWCRPS
jgi:plasmid stabilization system protein ParE